MRRREFIVGGAAIAASFGTGCERMKESKTKPTSEKPSRPEKAEEAAERPILVDEIVQQTAPCPFVFAGDRLGQLDGAKLVVREGPKWTSTLSFDMETPHGIAALDGGILAVLEDSPMTRIQILARDGGELDTFTGSVSTEHRRRSRLFRSSSPDRMIVASPGRQTTVELVSLEDGEIDPVADLALNPNDFATLTGLPDHSLIYAASGKLVQVGFGDPGRSYELGDSISELGHLAAGPKPDTVWASIGVPRWSDVAGGLLLLSLADPVKVLARVEIGVHHLARAGSRVAVLVVDQEAGNLTSLELVTYDAQGAELWRNELQPPRESHVPPYWVAGSDDYVAAGTESAITVFDAASGKKLN